MGGNFEICCHPDASFFYAPAGDEGGKVAAGLVRQVRFGLAEAHAKGAALQFNYLLEKGAIVHDAETGIFSVDFKAFENWNRELLQDVCILQATGDYAGTQKLFNNYVNVPAVLTSSLQKLQGIPVDIVPRYPLAQQLLSHTN